MEISKPSGAVKPSQKKEFKSDIQKQFFMQAQRHKTLYKKANELIDSITQVLVQTLGDKTTYDASAYYTVLAQFQSKLEYPITSKVLLMHEAFIYTLAAIISQLNKGVAQAKLKEITSIAEAIWKSTTAEQDKDGIIGKYALIVFTSVIQTADESKLSSEEVGKSLGYVLKGILDKRDRVRKQAIKTCVLILSHPESTGKL